MRLHTGTLTTADLHEAAQRAHVEMERMTEHGSRKRDHAFDVKLLGSSTHRPNGGSRWGHDDFAATWDEWGIFLAALYKADPLMVSWAYQSHEHFTWATGSRFADLTWAEQCRRHKWEFSLSLTGSYAVHECNKNCGAIRRFLTGSNFQDLQ